MTNKPRSRRPKASNSPPKSFSWWKMFVAMGVLVLGALAYLDAVVSYKLNERQWELPARVYARSLVLKPKMVLAADDLYRELKLLGFMEGEDWRRLGSFKRADNQFWITTRGPSTSNQGFLQGAVQGSLRFRLQFNEHQVDRLETAGGEALDKVALEPLEIGSIYPRHQEDRVLVKLDEVPRSLKEILLLIEDRHFYQHAGLSFRSIARALLANIQAGRTVQGGSTITQQLVKNVFLTSSRSLWRKVLEVPMSYMVEWHFSKDKILESYINEVYLGQEGPRAIHGFALASRHYFNRPLTQLDAGQVALLVGMVKGPSFYDPWRNPERAQKRRNIVLQVMAEHHLITAVQQQGLVQQPLGLAKSNALANVYPAYLDLVRRQLRRDYSDKNLQTEGLKIYTAFDPIVQYHAEQSLAYVLADKNKELQSAMVVTDVVNGDVVAIVGGRQMRYAGFNRALDAVRPIGSLIKPAVYLSALQQSDHYTLAALISDGPVEVAGSNGSVWRPKNFDRKSHGNVLLHHSLAKSYNQATARLGMEVGLPKVLDVVQQLGVTRKLPELPSMLLGAAALSPIEVAGMYQTIASAGVRSPLRSIVNISDHKGRIVARYPVVRKTVISKPIMHLLHYALVEVMQEGTGKSAYQRLPAGYLVAGKTGTTNDLRDSWFAGFAGDYLAVVWMGNDNNSSAGLTGSSGALKVWSEFIVRASHRPLDFSVPPGISYHWVDSDTGFLSRETCENSRYVPFLQGSAPEQRSNCQRTLPKVWKWFRQLF